MENNEFTLKKYGSLLKLAVDKYSVISYDDIENHDYFCIWRHDIDFSLESALRIAQVDFSYNVSSTFFVNLHADCYNALSPSGKLLLSEIAGLGHGIGLHVDASWYGGISTDSQLEQILKEEAESLSKAVGIWPKVFSFHNPSGQMTRFTNSVYGGMINCYSATFFHDIAYCSDSNGYWRYEPMDEVLCNVETRKVQILTHPEWWCDTSLQPRERLIKVLVSDAVRHLQRYDNGLKMYDRDNQSEHKIAIDNLNNLSSDEFDVLTVLSAYGEIESSIESMSQLSHLKSLFSQLMLRKSK